MSLPIHKILWAPSNAAHWNHLHVEGAPHIHGTLDNCTSKWTPAIVEIVQALNDHFGEGDHWMVNDPDLAWTNMGIYHCRNIAGSSTPSQHAFSNAIDIGPYYGVEEQQKFYDFLKGETDMAFTAHEEEQLKTLVAGLDEVGSNGTAVKYMVLHLRNHPSGGTVDQTARNIANAAADAAASALSLAKQIRSKLQNLY